MCCIYAGTVRKRAGSFSGFAQVFSLPATFSSLMCRSFFSPGSITHWPRTACRDCRKPCGKMCKWISYLTLNYRTNTLTCSHMQWQERPQEISASPGRSGSYSAQNHTDLSQSVFPWWLRWGQSSCTVQTSHHTLYCTELCRLSKGILTWKKKCSLTFCFWDSALFYF